jgi:DnaK suppressor protein
MASHDQFTLFTPYTETPGEEYMNEKQKAHFLDILNRWKSELMQAVDRTVQQMRTDQTNPADISDQASEQEAFALELRTRDRERRLITKISESINNLKKGDYGFCETCGADIGIRRLEARPTATMCIDCKTFAEIKERQTNL